MKSSRLILVNRLKLAGFLWILAAVLPVAMAEEALWVFEGLITDLDSELVPDLKSGWVLAGSFTLDPSALETEPVAAESAMQRLSGGISQGELTVDLYYQVHFEAIQVAGMAGFDYVDDDPEKDGRDLMGWFIPMRGKLKETEWSLRWLQVWIADSEGKMIRSLPPVIPANGLAWDSGWFRLTLSNEAGETVSVDGMLQLFSPESALEAAPDDWPAMVADLGARLNERDRTITELTTELYEVRSRLNGLRQMVDLLVEERDHLQDENAQLGEQAKLADPAIAETIAGLEADKALLETAILDLESENESLVASVDATQQERNRLAGQVASLENLVDTLSTPTPQPVVEPVSEAPPGKVTVSIEPIDKPVRLVLPAKSKPRSKGLRPWRLR